MKLVNEAMVEVDATAFNTAATALAAEYPEVARKIVRNVLTRSANVVRRNVRAGAARHRITGDLERGVHTTWAGVGMKFEVRVMSCGPVAHLITGGVRPHVIDPGHVMKIAGVIGFSERVQHPGFPGDPYVMRGARESLPAIQAIVDTAAVAMADDLAQRLGG